MSLPFPKLPLLIQLEVLKQLELQEIFLLSLCSEKMKRVVQCLNMKPTNLMYIFLESGVFLIAKYDNNHDPTEHPIGELVCVPVIPTDEMKQMKLGGNTISCRCVKVERECSHEFHYPAPEEIAVIESLQRHMRDLFQFKPPVQLDLASLDYLKTSDIINDVTETSFDVKELDTVQLENYLTSRPVQDSFHLRTMLTGPLLTSDSKLCSIKQLAVVKPRETDVIDPIETHQNSRQHFSALINNFSEEYLFFIDVSYDVNDWAHMIQRWKRKEAHHNLKFGYTRPLDGVPLTFEQTLQPLDFLDWDGQRRPRNVKLDPKIICLKLDCFKDMDCSEWMDIQQDGDGKWASILLSEEDIRFVVWD